MSHDVVVTADFRLKQHFDVLRHCSDLRANLTSSSSFIQHIQSIHHQKFGLLVGLALFSIPSVFADEHIFFVIR